MPPGPGTFLLVLTYVEDPPPGAPLTVIKLPRPPTPPSTD